MVNLGEVAAARIGTGPWYNVNGEIIARDLARLHGDTLEVARLGNNLTKQTGLTEKGQFVPGLNDYRDPGNTDWDRVKTTSCSNRHETLTGSQPDGLAQRRVAPPCRGWRMLRSFQVRIKHRISEQELCADQSAESVCQNCHTRRYGFRRWISFSFSLQKYSRISVSGCNSCVTLIVNGFV